MKITDYPQITSLESDNVFLVDGPNGTKNITAADLPLAVLDLLPAEMHRNIFRGKNIGTVITTEQLAAVQNGTFSDLWLGDYWQNGTVKWRIVDFDYWLKTGSTSPFNSHHLVVMPDQILSVAKMNPTNTTTGGYVGSDMYTNGLNTAKMMAAAQFPNAILEHTEYLITGVLNGYASTGAWINSSVELPNEIMICGHSQYRCANTGTNGTDLTEMDRSQLALFQMVPSFILSAFQGTYWLRDIGTANNFSLINGTGALMWQPANWDCGVRPTVCVG